MHVHPPSRVRVSRALSVLFFMALGACTDDASKRPLGASCTDNVECEAGVCGGGICLDPDLDTDLDGLVNHLEAALGTDPVVSDSDGDGVLDGVEIGGDLAHPLDTDRDGRIDALESATDDCDSDGAADQVDASDGLDAKGACRVVVVTPCPALCDRATALACPNVVPGCLTACGEAFTAMDATCRARFANAGACVAAAPEATCAEGTNPSWQLSLPDTACTEAVDLVNACLPQNP